MKQVYPTLLPVRQGAGAGAGDDPRQWHRHLPQLLHGGDVPDHARHEAGTMSDDGFVDIGIGKGGREQLRGEVSFSRESARFPKATLASWPKGLTWQWDGRGTVRARFSDDGELRVHSAPVGYLMIASAQRLQSAIGLNLDRQRFPIVKVDGNDVYIDVSKAMQS